jgi:endonuclease III
MHEDKIAWIIRQMDKVASKMDPPIFRAEKETKTPFKALVFTMLSARTKDDTTLRVVNELFAIENTPKGIASLGTKKLEKILYGIGFYKVKTKHLIGSCKIIERKGMPETIEGLLELPGVGRKTANIVLARVYGKKTLGVDVHVHRISNRLGLVKTKKPEETEKALVKKIPEKYLPKLNRAFVAFGQTLCSPRNPECNICPLNKICKRVGVTTRCPECKN